MSSFHARHPALEPVMLHDEPGRAVARVTARLTAYTADPIAWSSGPAASALDAFLDAAAAHDPETRRRQWWFTTSMMPSWLCTPTSGLGEVRDGLNMSALRGVRHQLELRLARHLSATDLGFTYREVDDRRVPRAGVIEIVLPPDATSALLQVAQALPRLGPLYGLVGGFGVSGDRELRSTAHWAAYRWCKRYLGVDLQDPEPMSLHAPTGLPGSNWLTYVSDRVALARGRTAAEIARQLEAERGVEVARIGDGALVVAGGQPVLGDANDFELPEVMSRAAIALEPLFVPSPPTYSGAFRVHEATRTYLRRLVDPIAWEAAPLDAAPKGVD